MPSAGFDPPSPSSQAFVELRGYRDRLTKYLGDENQEGLGGGRGGRDLSLTFLRLV